MADGMADFKPASVDHECPIFIYSPSPILEALIFALTERP